MRATPLFPPSLDPKQSPMTHLTCGYTAATVQTDMTRSKKIAALVTDEELVLDGDNFWVVIVVGDGTFLAAWVDKDGALHTASRKSAAGAIKLASGSWGR